MIEDRSQAPKSCIGLAVAAIIFLFPTFLGIPGLIRAIKARRAVANGDLQQAWELTNSSRRLSKIGLWVGVIFIIIYIVVYVILLANMTRSSYYYY